MIKLIARFVFCLPLLFLWGDSAYGRAGQAGTDSAGTGKNFLRKDSEEDLISVRPYLTPEALAPVPFSLRRVPDEKVKACQRDPSFAYANDSDYWKADRNLPAKYPAWEWLYRLIRSQAAHVILLLLFLLAVGYALYRLARENSFRWLDSRRKKNKLSGAADLPEQESAADLDRAISRYAEAGNFSLAVQYLYIRLIRAAFEKSIIQLSGSSTNTQIAETFTDPQQARDFRYLATAYEYVFYGGITPGREQFHTLQQKFNDFHQNLQD